MWWRRAGNEVVRDDVDLVRVSHVLAERFGDIPAAAKELGVSIKDLRRLTWHKPHLLDEAHERMELAVLVAEGELIKALDSPDDRRREWAAERILASRMGRDHPFAPAARSRGVSAAATQVTFSFMPTPPQSPAD